MFIDSQSIASHTFLKVWKLSKTYWRRSRVWRRRTRVLAANNVTFEIACGKTLALVGASGSGKSTVARCVAGLEKSDAGEIWINDHEIARLSTQELFPVRSEVQMVFQDPATAMNARMTAAEVIEEPLLIQQCGTREERRERVMGLMNEVGVSPEWMGRNIMQFSGGQQQRIAIARALTLRPKLLILDEAYTGLDLSTQAQIANLLLDLQATHGLTYLLISHDLKLVLRVADTITVMSEGEIVEQGPAAEILDNPTHRETKGLVLAAGLKLATAASGGPR